MGLDSERRLLTSKGWGKPVRWLAMALVVGSIGMVLMQPTISPTGSAGWILFSSDDGYGTMTTGK